MPAAQLFPAFEETARMHFLFQFTLKSPFCSKLRSLDHSAVAKLRPLMHLSLKAGRVLKVSKRSAAQRSSVFLFISLKFRLFSFD